MNRDDVDPDHTKRYQRSLKFIFCYSEIAIYNRVVVAPGKGGPCIHAHLFIYGHTVHFRWAADCEFHHSILRLSLHAKDLIQRSGSDRTLVRQWAFLDLTLTKRAPWFRVRAANGFGRVINFLHGCGQFFDIAFTADVHEVDFGLVEKEMVVQRSHLETIVECS